MRAGLAAMLAAAGCSLANAAIGVADSNSGDSQSVTDYAAELALSVALIAAAAAFVFLRRYDAGRSRRAGGVVCGRRGIRWRRQLVRERLWRVGLRVAVRARRLGAVHRSVDGGHCCFRGGVALALGWGFPDRSCLGDCRAATRPARRSTWRWSVTTTSGRAGSMPMSG